MTINKYKYFNVQVMPFLNDLLKQVVEVGCDEAFQLESPFDEAETMKACYAYLVASSEVTISDLSVF